MLQPPSITVIDYLPFEARVLKIWVTQASSCSSISWHIEDMHERFSMCNTNPENDLKSIRHPGHVNGRVILSSEFKGSSDSFTSFSFELLLLRVRLVATELDPSKIDAEELVFFGPHKLDITKEQRLISGLSGWNQTTYKEEWFHPTSRPVQQIYYAERPEPLKSVKDHSFW